MRYAIILSTAFATIALAGSAGAQSSNAPGKYCLRGMSGASQGVENCLYQTLAQCENSKASQKDMCFANTRMRSPTNSLHVSGSAHSGR